MKKILSILLIAVALVGFTCNAQKRTGKSATKTATKTSQASTTTLPEGFSIGTLVDLENGCAWFGNLSERLKGLGFSLIAQGAMTETSSSDGRTTGKTTTYTYGYRGITVKFTQAGRIEDLTFPNKQTFDQFVETAVAAGYKVEDDDLWDNFYQSPSENACFTSDGLKIWFQAAI